jgi:hypothetical protein
LIIAIVNPLLTERKIGGRRFCGGIMGRLILLAVPTAQTAMGVEKVMEMKKR